MKELSEHLTRIVNAAEPKLRKISAPGSAEPLLAGGWSRKQILGHLIESASNNHQRFVRALLQPSLEFPEYDQDGSVRVQAVQDADWELLVSLWAAYNRYLAHVLSQVPTAKLPTPCRIGTDEAITLESLARDYVTHLLHHLAQIFGED
jgi:hypothetical protein